MKEPQTRRNWLTTLPKVHSRSGELVKIRWENDGGSATSVVTPSEPDRTPFVKVWRCEAVAVSLWRSVGIGCLRSASHGTCSYQPTFGHLLRHVRAVRSGVHSTVGFHKDPSAFGVRRTAENANPPQRSNWVATENDARLARFCQRFAPRTKGRKVLLIWNKLSASHVRAIRVR